MREAAAHGLPYVYHTVDITALGLAPTDIGRIVTHARLLGFDALNVTHPCKQLVIEHLDRLDPTAARLGAVNTVVFGPDGVAATLPAGSVLVDCSTASPSLARDLADRLAADGRLFADAPVSGGSEGAQKGTLTVFLGGTDEAVALAMPVVQAFGARITHLGPAGSGQAAKAVNQVVLAGVYAGVAEGVVLAERFGLPAQELLEALGAGAADSWVLRNRAANMVGGSYPLGFRTSLHLKDVRIALREADAMDLPLDVARLVAQVEERLVGAGFGDEDVSNLARHVRGEDADRG
jgi:3-hydroxyisobutyrate dehydrogenase-like beta-hydroxyacid dehydrogenase